MISPPRRLTASNSSYERVRELRSLLSLGAKKSNGDSITAFVFRPEPHLQVTAPAAGLEGFVFAEKHLSEQYGREKLLHHLEDYARYMEDLLHPVAWTHPARENLRRILAKQSGAQAQYEQLIAFARQCVQEWQEELRSVDQAQWARQSRIYEIFPRAYNLPGQRRALGLPMPKNQLFFSDFSEDDLLNIKAMGFDAVWVMGIFPIGQRNRSGTAGGSPYSIQDHETIHPDLGTPAQFSRFVKHAHQAGLKVIIDFVPNHTSMDSKLLFQNPDFFIHQPADAETHAAPPRGYFSHKDPASGRRLWIHHGGYEIFGHIDYWIDTAQVDYSHEGLRQEMTRIVRSWIERFNIDAFRVDMAYLDLNANFRRAWKTPMPEREFLEELICSIKTSFPHVAFIAESYDNWDELSACGFDLIYGKNNMDRPGGHIGWYDALVSRDPGWIREGLKRLEYLQWQKGGSDMLTFIGNHDEPSPSRVFGPWMRGASFLTLMNPGSQLFYGSQEIGCDLADPKEHKSLPFSIPAQVAWDAPEQETQAFFQELFKTAQDLRREFKDLRLKALAAPHGASWVGYSLYRQDSREPVLSLLANPTDQSVAVDFNDPQASLCWQGNLPAHGYALIGPKTY